MRRLVCGLNDGQVLQTIDKELSFNHIDTCCEHGIWLTQNETIYGNVFVSLTVSFVLSSKVWGVIFPTWEMYICKCYQTLSVKGSYKGSISICMTCAEEEMLTKSTIVPRIIIRVIATLGPLIGVRLYVYGMINRD